MKPHDGTGEVSVSLGLYRRLQALALEQRRSVSELVEQAVEVHFGDTVVLARLRLIDRLARLEAGIGDDEELREQVRHESRRVREGGPRPSGT